MKRIPERYRSIEFTGCAYGSHAGNMLYSNDDVISASCMIPDDTEVSEEYGYLTLKNAIIADLESHGYATDDLIWEYDSCLEGNEDASADFVPGYTMEVNIDYEELENDLADTTETNIEDDLPLKFTDTFSNGVLTTRRRER